MLAYILAIAIAISSLILFGLAFFSQVIHRKDDFLWSGIGLFYALVLWLCAGRITGSVLLGQSAATILVISFGWQTLKLRRAIAYPDQPSVEFSVTQWVQNRLGSAGRKKTITPPTTTPQAAETPIIEENEEALASPSITLTEDETIEPVAQEIIETVKEENIETPLSIEPETEKDIVEVREAAQPEKIENKAPQNLTEFPKKATAETTKTELNQPKTKQKKGFSLPNFFGRNKKRPLEPTPEMIAKANNQTDSDLEEDEQWQTPQPSTNTTPAEEKTPSKPQPHDESSFTEATPVNSSEYEFETFVADEGAETVIEGYRREEVTPVDSSEYEFETFVADTAAETVIEGYQPDLKASQPEGKASSTPPAESKETSAAKDKNDSEVKDGNPEKSD